MMIIWVLLWWWWLLLKKCYHHVILLLYSFCDCGATWFKNFLRDEQSLLSYIQSIIKNTFEKLSIHLSGNHDWVTEDNPLSSFMSASLYRRNCGSTPGWINSSLSRGAHWCAHPVANASLSLYQCSSSERKGILHETHFISNVFFSAVWAPKRDV